MRSVTLDVVLVLPETLRSQAIACSRTLAVHMRVGGSAARFRLGEPFPGVGGADCEPHVSLFMLTVAEDEVSAVVDVVGRLAELRPAVEAEVAEYRHNPYGAVEVHFTRSAAWKALQRAVIDEVEPLRRGRLRDVDPSGTRLRDLVDDVTQDLSRRRQLLRYGYDEVADESNDGHDRLSPHVTLAWPRDPGLRVAPERLPQACVFSGLLTELGVFGMSAYGTCTRSYGTFALGMRSRYVMSRGDSERGLQW